MPSATDHVLTPRNIEIRDSFDAIARRYDLTNRVISCGVDLHWRKVAVRTFADLPKGGRVLDLACGTCDLALDLLRHRPDARVIGTDLSRAMLDIAARKVPAALMARGSGMGDGGGAAVGGGTAGPATIPLVNAPAEALPFATGVFDGAMIAFGIRNVPDYRAGLREMLRVLRPGGRIVVLEFSTPPSRLLWRVYNWYFFNVLPRIGGLITGNQEAYRYLTRSVSEFPGAPEFAGVMQECGFARVTWRSMTGGIACVHTGVRP